MKNIVPALMILSCLSVACSPGTSYEVKFCNNLEGNACIEQDSVFEFNKTVYIQFLASQPFEQDSIQGSIYGLMPEEENERFKFATKVFALQPDQVMVEHYIPFGRFGSLGKYEIEFSDMAGRVLGSGIMRIRHPEENRAN